MRTKGRLPPKMTFPTGTSREISIDWQAAGGLAYEARICRLARWVVEAERSGSRYALVLPLQRIAAGRGPDHRHACLRALALLPDV